MTNAINIPVEPSVQSQADEMVNAIDINKISFGEHGDAQVMTSDMVEKIAEELVRWEANFGFSNIALSFGVSVEQIQAVYNAILKRRGIL